MAAVDGDQWCIIANTPNWGAHKTSFYATRNSNGSILKVKTSSLLEFVIVHDFYDPSVIPLFTQPGIYGTVALAQRRIYTIQQKINVLPE